MSIRQWLSEKAGLVRAAGAALACVIGARIVAPGINPDVLGDFFRSSGVSPLARLYDWFVGGAMSRGGLLALMTAPGLWLQRITTQPPSNDQTAVAIHALEGAMALEEKQGGQLVIA